MTSSSSILFSKSSLIESSVRMEDVYALLGLAIFLESVKAMIKAYRKLSIRGKPSLKRMIKRYKMKQKPKTTNLS